jgi:RNA polymerase sigma-70 factor (ECF subfamily)
MTDPVAEFNQYRPLLFAIAYHMLGSVMDAEDMVQETFLRYQGSTAPVQSVKAYLTTIATHLCLDRLRSAQVQREQYIGPWLPEPLLTSAPSVTEQGELAESLSLAFLVILETLTPIERTVFLLREVFDYEYAEIATIVGKSPSHVRQIDHRAKAHVTAKRPRFEATRAEQERVTRQFLQTCAGGDMQGLLALLAADVVLQSDSGGKVSSARRPIYGAERVASFIFGLLKKAPPGFTVRLAEVNAQPALITFIDGRPAQVVALDIAEGRVQGIYIVVNPDKLVNIPALSG